MAIGIWHCRKNWSPLQRRTSRAFSVVMGSLVAASSTTAIFHSHSSGTPSTLATWVVALLPMLPLVAAVFIARRYLAQETDEFIKALVVRSLLSGLAITLLCDVFAGSVIVAIHSVRIPWALMSTDLFFVSTVLSFRVLRRAYREQPSA